MAITFVGTDGYVAAVGSVTPTIHASAATGDMMLCRIGSKPYNGTNGMPAGWTSLGTFADGTVGSGGGTGSVLVEVFWKEHDGSETDPTVTNASSTVSVASIFVWRKGATETWETPVGDGGGDTTEDTSFSATIQSHVSVTAGDVVDFFYALRDNSTMTVPTITQAGVTFDTVVEMPAIQANTVLGHDQGQDGGYRVATAGTSTAAAVITGTHSTNETGSGWMTRLRVVSGGTDDEATPSVVLVTVSIPAVVVIGEVNATATTTVLAVTGAFPPVVATSGAATTLTALQVTGTFPAAATVNDVNASATLTVLAVSGSLPAVVATSGAATTLTALQVAGTFPAATAGNDVNAAATLTALLVTGSFPVVVGVSGAVATLTVHPVTGAFPAVVVDGEISASATLTVLAVAGSFPAVLALSGAALTALPISASFPTVVATADVAYASWGMIPIGVA